MSAEVKDWITSHNKKAPGNEKLVVEFVDPCLTSIYQPPDVVMNVQLKRLVRQEYNDYVR